MLLSKCSHILKGAAAVGEYGLWFNPTLECTDFALESRFDTRRFHLLESAYLKLNPDNTHPLRLKVRRFFVICEQYLRSGRPINQLKGVWRRARRLVGY